MPGSRPRSRRPSCAPAGARCAASRPWSSRRRAICSPSRMVVSKMIRRSVMAISFAENKTARCVCKRAGQTKTLGRGRSASPERSKKKQEGRTDSRHHRINIAQGGSAVQALFVRFVGRCCNHAHRLALHLLPDVDAVARDAVGARTAPNRRPATWMLMTAMPSAIRTMTTNGTERLRLMSLKL